MPSYSATSCINWNKPNVQFLWHGASTQHVYRVIFHVESLNLYLWPFVVTERTSENPLWKQPKTRLAAFSSWAIVLVTGPSWCLSRSLVLQWPPGKREDQLVHPTVCPTSFHFRLVKKIIMTEESLQNERHMIRIGRDHRNLNHAGDTMPTIPASIHISLSTWVLIFSLCYWSLEEFPLPYFLGAIRAFFVNYCFRNFGALFPDTRSLAVWFRRAHNISSHCALRRQPHFPLSAALSGKAIVPGIPHIWPFTRYHTTWKNIRTQAENMSNEWLA